MTLIPADLPTLEELQANPPPPPRKLTPKEVVRATEDKKKKRPHLKTKSKSEALCKRQFTTWGATLAKARDDLITLASGQDIRVSKDVDFVGSIPLKVDDVVSTFPLKVESKGITVKNKRNRWYGSFPLSSLSDKERYYLQENRMAGGLSIVHIAWWMPDGCGDVHIIPWGWWLELERELKHRATGNFKGKSLRFHADTDLLQDYYVYKQRNRWRFSAGNWLAGLLPQAGEQTVLL